MRPPGTRLPGIGAHHSACPQTDEWLTPPDLLSVLGRFDLDPCAALNQPWRTATSHLTVNEDGLTAPWAGRVWLNPPYSEADAWLERLADHNHGTALVFARTETRWRQTHVWPKAAAVLFLAGRLTFFRPDGTKSAQGHNAGGPSALIAYGGADVAEIVGSGLAGALVSAATMLG